MLHKNYTKLITVIYDREFPGCIMDFNFFLFVLHVEGRMVVTIFRLY